MRLRVLWLGILAGCGGSHDAPDGGGAGAADAASATLDSGAEAADAGTSDAPAATADAARAAPPDAASMNSVAHAHILIDNFCNTSVDPPSFTVAAGDTLQITWHNH